MAEELAGLPVVRDDRVPPGCVIIGHPEQIAAILSGGPGRIDLEVLRSVPDEVAVLRVTRRSGA